MEKSSWISGTWSATQPPPSSKSVRPRPAPGHRAGRSRQNGRLGEIAMIARRKGTDFPPKRPGKHRAPGGHHRWLLGAPPRREPRPGEVSAAGAEPPAGPGWPISDDQSCAPTGHMRSPGLLLGAAGSFWRPPPRRARPVRAHSAQQHRPLRLWKKATKGRGITWGRPHTSS